MFINITRMPVFTFIFITATLQCAYRKPYFKAAPFPVKKRERAPKEGRPVAFALQRLLLESC